MGTWIIGSIVVGLFIWIGYRTYKEYKSGDSCQGGCPGCSHGSKCSRN